MTLYPQDMTVFTAQQKKKFTNLISATQKSMMNRQLQIEKQKDNIAAAEASLHSLEHDLTDANRVRKQSEIVNTKLRLERLREALAKVEHDMALAQKKISILQADADASAMPFYDQFDATQARVRELELMDALLERHKKETDDMATMNKDHFDAFSAISGISQEQVHEEQLFLQITETELKRRQMEEIANLQEQFKRERAEAEANRLEEMKKREEKNKLAQERMQQLDTGDEVVEVNQHSHQAQGAGAVSRYFRKDV